jgi:hypothetical protein
MSTKALSVRMTYDFPNGTFTVAEALVRPSATVRGPFASAASQAGGAKTPAPATQAAAISVGKSERNCARTAKNSCPIV